MKVSEIFLQQQKIVSHMLRTTVRRNSKFGLKDN